MGFLGVIVPNNRERWNEGEKQKREKKGKRRKEREREGKENQRKEKEGKRKKEKRIKGKMSVQFNVRVNSIDKERFNTLVNHERKLQSEVFKQLLDEHEEVIALRIDLERAKNQRLAEKVQLESAKEKVGSYEEIYGKLRFPEKRKNAATMEAHSSVQTRRGEIDHLMTKGLAAINTTEGVTWALADYFTRSPAVRLVFFFPLLFLLSSPLDSSRDFHYFPPSPSPSIFIDHFHIHIHIQFPLL